MTILGFMMNERRWQGLILAVSAAVVLISAWCLPRGITTFFMHLYYIPIVLLAYHYRWKGFWLSFALALVYPLLVLLFEPDKPGMVFGAGLQVLILIGIAAVIAYLSESLGRADEAGKQLRDFRENVISSANVWISVLSPDGTILLWNEAAAQISGYPAEDVVGRKYVWKQLYPDPGYRRHVTQEIIRIIKHDSSLDNFKTRIRCADGAEKTLLWNARATRDTRQGTTGYVAIGRDITAQIDAERRAAESEKKFQHLFESMQEGFAYCRMLYSHEGTPEDFVYLAVNPSFNRIIGVTTVIGRPVTQVFPGIREAFPQLFEIYGRVARSGTAESFELDFTPSGRWLNISVYSPEPDHFVAIFSDITERRIAQTTLLENETLLNDVGSLAHIGGWELDVTTQEVRWTKETYRIHDLPEGGPQDLKTALGFFDMPGRERLETAIRHCIASGDPFDLELPLTSAAGRHLWTRAIGAAIGKDNRILKLTGTLQDITERKLMGDRLHESRRQLAEAMDLAHLANWEFDVATGLFTFDDRFYALYGTTTIREGGARMPAEIYAREFVHPEDRYLVEAEIRKALETTEPDYTRQIEHRIIRRDGEVRRIMVRFGVVKDSSGKTVKTFGANQDITELRKAEEALRSSEGRLNTLIRTIPDLVWLKDADGVYLSCNPAFERFFGAHEAQIVGRTDYDFVSRDLADFFRENDKKAMAAGKPTSNEEWITFADDGRRALLETIKTPVYDTRGGLIGVLGIGREITQRKQFEEELRASRQLFADIISFLPDPTFVIDRQGVVLAWNQAMENLSGVPAGDMLGRGKYEYSLWLYGMRRPIIIDLVFNPDLDAARMNYYNVRRDGTTLMAETKVTLPSGKTVILSLVASPLVDEKGNLTGAIESMRDITRIKETEADLERLNANLEQIVRERTRALEEENIQRKNAEQKVTAVLDYTRSVIEANPDLMVVLDQQGIIQDVNTAAEALTGVPRNQLIGTSYVRYLADNTTPPGILDILREKGRVSYTVQIRRSDGHITPLSVNSTLVTGTGEAGARIIVAGHDITRQKQDEAALRAAFDEQVILLREIHHRVKNNLQIIISLTNLQMRKTDDPGAKQIMTETQNRVRAMSLVHEKLYRSTSLSQIDFADYTRFLASQLISFYAIDARRVILEISMEKMMVDINTAVPLGLVLNELVSNSLKHAFPDNRKGTLSITGGIRENTLTIVVRDDGVGLPPGCDWNDPATLGMRLVRSLVEQIDGTITLAPSPGTEFTISLPYSPRLKGAGSMPLSGSG